ncbi:MAG: NYN domain-containing protein [Alphaproteobacteria bacterium]|nr:MAG: NYN domain-containing protein [Alphaproteobacteria bacterium]
MKREAGGPCLSAVFVDYDNIYLSLKRKSEEAAKRFAKDASGWLRGIETGRLITPTNAPFTGTRRIVMNRCYGNPVPRRNTNDNSTDMNSFPFVRHHFLRAGFEVIDCPPLTAQLKNSSDIRMVMDIRDYLTHDTYFDEFVILSGDADFTPVLHRLRAHARRTVIFANDYTAAPYTAISDGEVRESDLIALILNGELPKDTAGDMGIAMPSAKADENRREILAEVVGGVRGSSAPVPLEALAERAMRALGHEKTIGTSWAGAGTFRELLRQQLPAEIKLTSEPPYLAFDPKRHGEDGRATALEGREPGARQIVSKPAVLESMPLTAAALQQALPASALPPTRPGTSIPPAGRSAAGAAQVAAPPVASSAAIQQSITRIQEACQAPPLAPHEYRLLFEVMAKEISDNDLIGAQTLANITQRAQERGLDVRRDDVRFVLEVVSEADPWFEQGASANLFAGRFRNFVVARCRGQGLNLSADELDLIDAWFAGGSLPQQQATQAPPAPPAYASEASHPRVAAPAPRASPAQAPSGLARWWSSAGESRSKEAPETRAAPAATQSRGEADDFPRIIRTRLRN